MSRGVALGCLTLGGLANLTSEDSTRLFTSAKYGYSANVPAEWHVFDESRRRGLFDVINFPLERRVEGVFLPEHGAEIVVSPGGRWTWAFRHPSVPSRSGTARTVAWID